MAKIRVAPVHSAPACKKRSRTLGASEHRAPGTLEMVQPAIWPVGGEQLGVGASLYNGASLEHEDLCGVLNRREAMRNHKHGAAFE